MNDSVLPCIAQAIARKGAKICEYLAAHYKEFRELYDHAIETGENPTIEQIAYWINIYDEDMKHDVIRD